MFCILRKDEEIREEREMRPGYRDLNEARTECCLVICPEDFHVPTGPLVLTLEIMKKWLGNI